MFDSKGNVFTCSPINQILCPDEAICRFNFWTVTHQCCRQNNKLSKLFYKNYFLYLIRSTTLCSKIFKRIKL
jgi:hypothetical protein